LSTDELQQLRQLHQQATHGRWEAYDNVVVPDHETPDEDTYRIAVCRPENAALIAAMRNTLPALLDIAEAATRIAAFAGGPERNSWTPVPTKTLGKLADTLTQLQQP
jgi:hypothetical protein